MPCIERLIESLAYEQFSEYINANQLLSKNQSGFRAQHSCESAINDVLYDWQSALEEKKVIVAVFLDFKRAFETVDCDIQLHKLEEYGVRDSSLNWFSSYLKNRRQVVKIGETKSDEIVNNMGVPQGSILGPLLFILYINNIVNCLKFCTAKLFADDTLIYVVADSIEEAKQKINDDLCTLYDKLCQYKLKLNISKTKVMLITNKTCDTSNLDIFMGGNKLDIVNEIKYLGVILDDKLNFDKNISHVCRKLGQKLNVICRLRNDLNCEQKLSLYKSIIQPHLSYCASILFLSKASGIERIQNIQTKILRQIVKANRHTSREFLLSTLKILSVNQTVIFSTMIFIFKIINGHTAQYLTERIHYNHENTQLLLRNANDIKLTNSTKSCSQNALFYKGIQTFNSLPPNIKFEKSFTKFKKLLYEYVIHGF